MYKGVTITKENYKDLVVEYVKKEVVTLEQFSARENPSVEISEEGMLMVMMTIISQNLARSWYYKMKNQAFNKYFNKVMSKYSYSTCMKLFDNKNFKLVAKQFFEGEGLTQAMEENKAMQENSEAYSNAVQEFLSKC